MSAKCRCDRCGKPSLRLNVVDPDEIVQRQFCDECTDKLIVEIEKVIKNIEKANNKHA